MAEEAAIPFEQIPVHPRESINHAELLTVNPLEKIPALKDDNFTLLNMFVTNVT